MPLSSQFSETFLVTTRPLLTWLSTMLFAVFRDFSGDKNPEHPDLTAYSATPIPSNTQHAASASYSAYSLL